MVLLCDIYSKHCYMANFSSLINTQGNLLSSLLRLKLLAGNSVIPILSAIHKKYINANWNALKPKHIIHQINGILELEAQIEMLRETQRKYNGILRLSSALTAQLTAAGHTQRALGEAFAELAQKSPELQNQ